MTMPPFETGPSVKEECMREYGWTEAEYRKARNYMTKIDAVGLRLKRERDARRKGML